METDKPVAWGDEEFEDAVPSTPEDDIKVVVEYIKRDGKKIKVTRKIKTQKVVKKLNKAAAERRKTWVKFGECAGKPPGPEAGVTTNGDFVEITFVKQSAKKEKSVEEQLKKEILDAVTRKTAPTWAARRAAQASGQPIDSLKKAGAAPGAPMAPGAPGADKYVPPSQRGGRGGPGAKPDETSTVRVTNLSEETSEQDLATLFRPFGPISRIFLAKDKITGDSKGFAFINFFNREDAEEAMNALNGTGFDYLILNIEWAQPSIKKP